MIEDVLSWERFEKDSDLALPVLPKKVELYLEELKQLESLAE